MSRASTKLYRLRPKPLRGDKPSRWRLRYPVDPRPALEPEEVRAQGLKRKAPRPIIRRTAKLEELIAEAGAYREAL